MRVMCALREGGASYVVWLAYNHGMLGLLDQHPFYCKLYSVKHHRLAPMEAPLPPTNLLTL